MVEDRLSDALHERLLDSAVRRPSDLRADALPARPRRARGRGRRHRRDRGRRPSGRPDRGPQPHDRRGRAGRRPAAAGGGGGGLACRCWPRAARARCRSRRCRDARRRRQLALAVAIVGRLRPQERAHPVCSWSWIRLSSLRPRTGSGAGWAAGSTAGSVSVSAPWPAAPGRARGRPHRRRPGHRLPSGRAARRAAARPTALVRDLAQPDRRALARLGVRFGQHHVFVPDLLKPAASRRARACVSSTADRSRCRPGSHGAAVALSGSGRGHAVGGVRCIRRLRRPVDILERIAAQVRAQARDSVSFSVPPTMAAEAGLTRAELAALVEALGFRPEAARRAWWPTRPAARRRDSPGARRATSAGPVGSPFAVLAGLRPAPRA